MSTVNLAADVRQNVRDLPRAMNFSAFFAGFITRMVGYTGPLVIVLQAAQAGGLSTEQTASWIWGVGVANGIATIVLSLLFRMPIMAAWSTAGAVLLTTAFAQYTLPEVIGANLAASLLLVVLGLSGLFGRVMAVIPQPVVLGMLAGILLQFGVNMFTQLNQQPLLVVTMLFAYLIMRRLRLSVPILGAFIVGLFLAVPLGLLRLENVTLGLTQPMFFAPVFRLDAMINVALPLVLLSLTSQYAPGQAVLQASGYRPPINGILVITGLFGAVFAPTSGHGVTLGALTTAMVTSPDAHPDPKLRYAAAVSAGFWSIMFGVFATTVVSLFAGLPLALTAVLAGLGLGNTIANSLAAGFTNPEGRDGALMAFLCAASGITLLGIGAPFWALIVGVVSNWVINGKVKAA